MEKQLGTEPACGELEARAGRPCHGIWAAALVVVVFVVMLPTLAWQEFTGGSENLNVATVLEMRRSGNYLFPTLGGLARVNKPPLTAWITSAFVRPATLEAIATAKTNDQRDAAYGSLAWEVRLSAWVVSCLMLLAAYALARAIAPDAALASLVICASSLLFFRYARGATTDVQLALWVTAANACFAHALLRGRRWMGVMGGSAALALAFMSKGPVALAQTVAPFLIFIAVRSRSSASTHQSIRRCLVPMLVGVLIFMGMAAPWYVAVASRNPEVWRTWLREVFRAEATDLPSSNPFSYIVIVPMMLPWIIFFCTGIGLTVRGLRARVDGFALALLLLVAPILIMSCVRDRKERYLLPLCVPAAIVAARAIAPGRETSETSPTLKGSDPFNRAARDSSEAPADDPAARQAPPVNADVDRWAIRIHWFTAALFAFGLIAAGSVPFLSSHFNLRTLGGQPWFSPATALVAAAACGGLLLMGVRLQYRSWRALPLATLGMMLSVQLLFAHGYAAGAQGRSSLRSHAYAILDQYPDARFYTIRPGEPLRIGSNELAIYLNRTVVPIDDLTKLPPADRPQIVFLHIPKSGQTPPIPPNIVRVGQIREDKDRWDILSLGQK